MFVQNPVSPRVHKCSQCDVYHSIISTVQKQLFDLSITSHTSNSFRQSLLGQMPTFLTGIKLPEKQERKVNEEDSQNISQQNSLINLDIKRNGEQFRAIAKQMREQYKKIPDHLGEIKIENLRNPVHLSFSRFQNSLQKSGQRIKENTTILRQMMLTEQLQQLQKKYEVLQTEYKQFRQLSEVKIDSIEPIQNTLDEQEDELFSQSLEENIQSLIRENESLKQELISYKLVIGWIK